MKTKLETGGDRIASKVIFLRVVCTRLTSWNTNFKQTQAVSTKLIFSARKRQASGER